MFGLFKKKTPEDILREKYQKLTQEAFKLSTSDRKASDQKAVQANEVLKQIEALKK